ncbi:MAG: sodium:solute symporter [Kiritimatiellae bacterium]|nr:sodium:solute symporter [Kiritimatiellia bacterium]
MRGSWSGADSAVVLVYFTATLTIGLALGRTNRTAEGFTVGERSLPGWVCGLSIFATFLSSISFLAIPGGAFARDWSWFVFSLTLPPVTWLAVRVFLPLYRRSGEISAYALLERRFGPWARWYADTFYLLTQLARMGTVLYLMAMSAAMLADWDIRTVILATGGIVTAYAFVGGLVAVVWTDALQALVLIVGALVALILLLTDLPEGPAQVLRHALAHRKLSLGSLDPSTWSAPTFWVVLLHGLAINLQNFGIDQNYVQRYLAPRSDREARRGVWLGGLLYVPVSATLLLIGTSLHAWYHAHPAELAGLRAATAAQRAASTAEPIDPAQLDDVDLGDRAFPHFIATRLPHGLAGLLVAAILAAGMSTVSTSLNSSATLLVTDLYQRLLRPNADDPARLRTLHAATLAVGTLGTGAALLMVNARGALDAWWKLASAFSGGLGGLFLLGVLSRRAGSRSAAAAVALGVLAIAWMTWSPTWPEPLARWRSPLHPYLTVAVATAVILIFGMLFGRFESRPRTASSTRGDPP